MQTATSSEKLAVELEKVGLTKLAEKARRNYYHDFFSNLTTPAMQLANDLFAAAQNDKPDEVRDAILELRRRHIHDGEFDATVEESDQWAASEEGRETFGRLVNKRP